MRRRWPQGARAGLRVVLGWLGVLLVGGTFTVALPTPQGEADIIETFTCYSTGDEDPDSGATTDTFITFQAVKDNAPTPGGADDGNASTFSWQVVANSQDAPNGRNNTGEYAIEAMALRPGGTAVWGNAGAVFSVEHDYVDGTANNGDDVGILGNIDVSTGDFVPIGTNLGSTTNATTYDGSTSAYTSNTNLTFDDVDGLTFDPFTNKLWGVVRIPDAGTTTDYDFLFIIDPRTGTFVPGQFRNPATNVITDAIAVAPVGGGDNAAIGDIDDLSIDPSDGTLYGVANSAGQQDRLVSINKITGQATVIGTNFGITDIEGLGFSNVGDTFGDFFATTGDDSTTTTQDTDGDGDVDGFDDNDANRFWIINKTNGTVSPVDDPYTNLMQAYPFDNATAANSIPSDATIDTESMDCLSSNVVNRRVTGYAYVDEDQDGVFESGAGEAGFSDASVRLYIDNNNDNAVDGGDTLVDNAITSNGSEDVDGDGVNDPLGFYSFEISFPSPLPTNVPRNFVLDINTNTLPGGHIMTDGGNEEASFPGDPPNSDDAGSTNGVANTDGNNNNVNNNFGFIVAPSVAKTSNNTGPGGGGGPAVTDPILPGTDQIEYTISLTNSSGTAATNVRLTDTLPAGTAYVAASITYSQAPDTTTRQFTDSGGVANQLDVTFNSIANGVTVTVTFDVTTDNATLASANIVNTACTERTVNGTLFETCDSETDPVVGRIGDFVWNDANEDVVQDGGETGIASITVELLTSGGDGNCSSGNEASVATTTTDASGNYLFSRLGTNEYCVNPDGNDPDMPAGYQLTGAQTEPMLVSLNVAAAATRFITNADFGYDAAPAAPPPPDPEIIDLELTKSVNPQVVNLGDEVTWSITLTNASPGATDQATGVTVQDDLPSGVTFVSATPSKGTYDEATGVWDVGSMNVGEIQTLEIVVTVDEPGFHTNIAYVTDANETDIDSQPGPPKAKFQDDEDNATVKAAVVDLELTKDVSDETVAEGQEFTFDITVEHVAVPNVDPITATNVRVGDTVPDGLRVLRVSSSKGTFDTQTFIWFVGDLEVNQSATLTLFVIAEREGTFTNVAQVVTCDQSDVDSTPNNDDPGEDDQDDATVTLSVIAALGDYVWLDKNGDGVQDLDEVGIPGVTIAIAGPFHSPPNSGRVQASAVTQTDDSGSYLFGSLVPGLYIVVIAEDTLPGQLARTTATNSYEVVLTGGTTYLDADFGYQPSAAPPEPEPGLPVTGGEEQKLAIAGSSMLAWGLLVILWTARRQPQPAHAAYRRRRRSPGNRRDPLKVDVIRPPGRRRWWHR